MRTVLLLLPLVAMAPSTMTPTTVTPTDAAGQDTKPTPLVIPQIEGSPDVVASRAVMELAYKRIGVPVRFELCPGAESLVEPGRSRYDGELARIDGADRRYTHLVQVPIPIDYIQGAAFSKKYAFPVRGWHSLRPYRLGIVRGIIFTEQGTEGMDVKVAESVEQLMQWIANDIVDVGIVLRLSGLQALLSGKHKGIKEMRGVLETIFVYHYVRKKNRHLVPRLAPVLKKMLLDGTTRRLRRETNARLLGKDG